MMTRKELIHALRNYETDYNDEAVFIEQFLQLLAHPRAYYRDHLPGHMTASAWIVDASERCTLLTHHAKLNRWLQPGGHADGNEDILSVALNEAREETGLNDLKLPSPEVLFDIDIHTIPRRKEVPEHLHYDIRVLMFGTIKAPLEISTESHDLKWIPFEQIGIRSEDNSSILRMLDKTIRLLAGYQQ